MIELFKDLLNKEIIGFMIIFARIIGFLSSTPGLYEKHIPQRSTLAISMVISLICWSLMRDSLIDLQAKDTRIIFILVQEFLIGYLSGAILRLLFASLHFAGSMIANQIGLGNVLSDDVAFSTQSTIISGFLSNVCTLLIFITGLHYSLIKGFLASYEKFPITFDQNFELITNTFTQMAIETMQISLYLSLNLAAPVWVLIMFVYIGMGFLNKMIPQVPIFFIIQPLQLFVGLSIIIVIISGIITKFFTSYTQLIESLLYKI